MSDGKDELEKMNVEHRTSNIQRRMKNQHPLANM